MGFRFETDGVGRAVEDLNRAIAATLRTISTVRTERVEAPTRAARLTLVAVHGATRLQRLRERDALDA